MVGACDCLIIQCATYASGARWRTERAVSRNRCRPTWRCTATRPMSATATRWAPTWQLARRGSWAAQGFRTAEQRATSINLRELRVFRMLLHWSFFYYVSDRRMCKILVHEYKQSVVCVLNTMVSASKPMMAELRKIRKLLHAMGVPL